MLVSVSSSATHPTPVAVHPGPYHTQGIEELLNNLVSSRQGLTPGEAAARLQQFGPNALPTKNALPCPKSCSGSFLVL